MAEVAVAFAGFTALASVLTAGRGRHHPKQSSYLLRGMIETSLLVVLFSFVPLILDGSALAPSSVMRASSGACAALWLVAAAVYTRGLLILQRELSLPMAPWYVIPMSVSTIVGNSLFLLTASGVIVSSAGSAYSAGLLCVLANSAFSFIRFFFGAYEQPAV